MYDLIIRGGTIVDGTGSGRYIADIAIDGKKIVKIGDLKGFVGVEEIDARDYIVAPGFIDDHCHGDLTAFGDPLGKNQLLQGITTEVGGNCGISFAPQGESADIMVSSQLEFLPEDEQKKYLKPQTFPEFMNQMEMIKLGPNLVCYVGQGIVRAYVMGYESGSANKEELEKMKDILDEAMSVGAAGMSTGLVYPTGSLTDTEELIELSKVVAKHGKHYATHMRDEGDHVVEAVKEAIRIAKESGAKLVISHHKASGYNNYGKTKETLALIDEAIASGVDVHMDVYPYVTGATNLVNGTFPKEYASDKEKLVELIKNPEERNKLYEIVKSGEGCGQPYVSAGGPDGVIIGSAPGCEEVGGKNLIEAGKILGCDPYEALLHVVEKTKGAAVGVFRATSEEDLQRVLKHERAMFGTDASHSTVINNFGHPRAWGSFPHIIKNYVREKEVMTLEEFSRKASALPCEVLGIKSKGLIKEGYDADIVVFDYDRVEDLASYEEPNQPCKGMKNVIVNGKIAVIDDEITGIMSGSLVRV